MTYYCVIIDGPTLLRGGVGPADLDRLRSGALAKANWVAGIPSRI